MHSFIVICTIGFIILVHETGHLIAARMARIPVRAFSIGFGPVLFRRRIKGTEYRLSLLPLGGYILPDTDSTEEYFALPVRGRIIFSVGGPLANGALTLILLSVAAALSLGVSLHSVLIVPLQETARMASSMAASIPAIFTGPQRLTGIVGIAASARELAGTGTASFLIFTASLSMNVAIINLLPLPALDGGKILLSSMEKIHRSVRKIQVPLAIAGWLCITAAMIYVTINDVIRILA